ncbi:tol-pal system-associated acyl-CoA thioesterase [Achromobacter sp. GG226]|uniref:tol-pal system-associated acyl-CoA thioesterase n=1 Tax=Verticiella alkaliphila TaxID=2779529 RepID=UPI001C0ADA5C|nr:tol-pal system-associated acyl-CoA thioesterase [Verticiella sp. GG226]MBU4612879.1 tol-pal system-associated acyl-CoA thioesterase [Verticiella sp. GG226]
MSAVPRETDQFRFDVRVYYEDTDAGGVVYYANYLKFFERARTEWLRRLGFEQAAVAQSEGRLFVVRSASVDYHRPARLDDALVIRSRVARAGRASILFEQSCLRDGELLAAGRIDIACVSTPHMRPAALPEALARQMRAVAPA